MTIVLVRHAETVLAGRFCGQSDPDLNCAGEQQLACIAPAVASLGIQRILSSDLRRARRTAEAIARQTGIPIELHPALREIDFGLWEGLNWSQIEARNPREAQTWVDEFPMRTAPAGEPYREFTERIDNAFAPLLQSDADDVTAVVTHRGVMRHVLIRHFGYSEQKAFGQTEAYGAVIRLADPSAASCTVSRYMK